MATFDKLSASNSTIRFYLNGSAIALDGNSIDPDATLLDFIRSQGSGFTGTKLGCGEGGCGACTVVMQERHPLTGVIQHKAINSCLSPLVSADGKHIVTVEALGDSANPHPLQERMWKLSGSQCGFCTPGIIMSLYALLRNAASTGSLTVADIELEGALDGNLCRCTGYKPILDAAKSFVGEYIDRIKANGIKDPKDFVVPVNFTAANLEDAMVEAACCSKTKEPVPPKGCGRTDCCQLGDSTSSPLTSNPPFPKFQFEPYRPDTELIFPPALHRHDFLPLAFGNNARKWFRPTTLAQVLDIKAAYPHAKFVGGSSEIQIEVKQKGASYPVSVYISQVPELLFVSLPTAMRRSLEFGANVPLTEIEDVCREVSASLDSGLRGPLDAISNQLRYFAGRQIRNVASVGGNLATASPISDLNPVWMATGTKVIAMSAERGEIELLLQDFFTGYRKTTLPADAVIVKVIVPLNESSDREVVRAYKQAKRKDDDIAIVTACFSVKVDPNGTISEARLAFGGMAAYSIMASKTQAHLIGKPVSSEALDSALDVLGTEFDLAFNVPGGMPSYRKTLALSFLFKFLTTVSVTLDLPLAKSVAASETDVQDIMGSIHRQPSSGRNDNSDPHAKEVVGKSIPHLSGLKHCTGEAVYVDDMPALANEGYGALVLSAQAHAKITVDASAALEMPGVVCWVDHTDLPTEGANFWGAVAADEVFFAVDEVVSYGQPIGMIVAKTKLIAQRAAAAVLVTYDLLPMVLTLEEAIAQESFHPQYKRQISRGLPIDEALAGAEIVLEGRTRMGGQEHFYLETMSCLAIPKHESGEIEVYASTQAITDAQRWVAQVTGVPRSHVVVKSKRMGGGFGGKETRSSHLSAIVALAAKKSRRPVRTMLDRNEDIKTTGQRHPCLADWTIGCTGEGKLVALKSNFYANAGYSLDISGGVVDRALAHIDNSYWIPNVDVHGRCAKTNTVSNTAFRGFGGPQGMIVAEHFLEAIAHRLDLDIDHVRRLNLYAEGQLTPYHQEVNDWHVPRLLAECRTASEYDQRSLDVAQFNKEHKYRKRGLALLPTKFGLAFGVKAMNQGAALVHIYMDGSVLVAHGGTEMGQGLYTKCAQIAAEELGVPLSAILTSETSTNTVPNTVPTAGSAGSDLQGHAVHVACQILKERLTVYREKLGSDAPFSALAGAAWADRVSLSTTGHYSAPNLGYEWGNQAPSGNLFMYFTQGVAATEVEIDCLTGDSTVLRVDILMDVGKSLNPTIDIGQINGAFLQGMGVATLEESLWLQNGALFTQGPGSYKIPGFSDIPQVFNTSLLHNAAWPNLTSIHSSKGIGEPPLFLGYSVALAMRQALKSARADNGVTELQEFRLPMTSERIRLACGDALGVRGRVEQKEGEKGFFVHI